jgi:lysyl-tRNA synthetase class 2
MSDLFKIRLQKLRKLRELGIEIHPDRFDISTTLADAKELPDGEEVSVAGRMVAFRPHGKLIFADLQDIEGRLQVAFAEDKLPEKTFYWISNLLDIGDLLGVKGAMFTSHQGERTVAAEEVAFLGKSLRPLPSKWVGTTDPDIRARQRYLDLIANAETRQVFLTRSRMITFMRGYLEDRDFIDVDTPVLQPNASGASARPFKTHHNALDMDFYLRISPETYLKRLIVGGFTKIYEIGKCFRNEGLDNTHLNEFTMLEAYIAYWNAARNLAFIRDFIKAIVQEFCGGLQVEYQGTTLDFSGEWQEHTYTDLVRGYTGIDLSQIESLEHLKSEIQRAGVDFAPEEYVSLASLMDALYKKTVRPKLIQPMFLTQHPAELVPLARRNDGNPRVLDMFQVVVNGWEIVKAYSELVYGMPPISGLGLGVDRLVALICDAPRLKDVTLFPMMRWGENE